MENENFSGTDKLLGEKPVFGLLMKMAVPTMISMFIQSMYNIVDSIFVTRINDSALNAVSLVYPLQNLVLALSANLPTRMPCTAYSLRFLTPCCLF